MKEIDLILLGAVIGAVLILVIVIVSPNWINPLDCPTCEECETIVIEEVPLINGSRTIENSQDYMFDYNENKLYKITEWKKLKEKEGDGR